MEKLSREIPLNPAESVLLIVDVQNYCCSKDGGEYQGMAPEEFKRYDDFFERMEQIVFPNIERIQAAFRQNKMEVMFTLIESPRLNG